jgi:hypothetical protein
MPYPPEQPAPFAHKDPKPATVEPIIKSACGPKCELILIVGYLCKCILYVNVGYQEK